MTSYDYIIVGSGFAGAVCARELASRSNKKVLVIEKREHIAGNAYDCHDNTGILIHKYGPHIFHTESSRVFNYLSRFCEWRPYEHKVVAKVNDLELPVPFNLNSLHLAYEKDKADSLEKKLIESYGAEKKIPISVLRESRDSDIRELAEYVYNNIFLHYTVKQWGKTPEEIDPATTARIPVFLSRDDRYFQDKYQGMPKKGYTALFERMLDHPNIEVRTGFLASEFIELKNEKIYFCKEEFDGGVIYSGALDELFEYKFGQLPYRTLDFVFEQHTHTHYQSHGTVNYTVDMPFTRITEFKYLTGQQKKDRTTIVKEYSKEYNAKSSQIPYYPVINPESCALYQKYAKEAKNYPSLFLAGRLAEYKYYNMDQIVLQALELCDKLISIK